MVVNVSRSKIVGESQAVITSIPFIADAGGAPEESEAMVVPGPHSADVDNDIIASDHRQMAEDGASPESNVDGVDLGIAHNAEPSVENAEPTAPANSVDTCVSFEAPTLLGADIAIAHVNHPKGTGVLLTILLIITIGHYDYVHFTPIELLSMSVPRL